MNKGFLGSLAALLSAAGLALGQAPASLPSAADEGATPAPSAERAVGASVPERPPLDRWPWNPNLKQGAQWPYPDLPHAWLSGLCPDLGDFWLSADYLLWGMKGSRLPALVTVSPPDSRGILGQPGTSILFGNGDVNSGAFS